MDNKTWHYYYHYYCCPLECVDRRFVWWLIVVSPASSSSQRLDGHHHRLDLGLVMTFARDFDLVSQTGRTLSQDRRPCEVVSQTPGLSTLVSVNAPLQLGGRSNVKVTHPDVKVMYPDSVIRDGFDGCIKNLYHYGQVGISSSSC